MRVIRALSVMAALVSVSASAAQISLAGAQTASRSGDVPADRHKQVDALFAPWSGTTTPGCAVAISRDGVLDYARGYGMSNLEYDVAITPDSIFHVASVSKQFTAFAIGLLAQDGKLSLEDDIRKYLPELPDYGHKVTIAQMVHHTAGMREEFHLMSIGGWRSEDPRAEADALRISAKQRALNFAPGTEALYSNSHYTLLATVVQRVSGKPLRVFAEERMFRPLGMTDTHFQDGHTEVVRRRASGYRAVEGGWRTSLPRSDYYGASNAVLQLEVKDGVLRAVGSPDPLVPIGDGVFRVGTFKYEWRFSAPAAGAPAHAPRELRILENWPTPRMFTRLTTPVPSAAALAAYAGQYRSDEVDMTYTVGGENGKLSVRWARGAALTLQAVGGDHFIDGIYTVTFTRAASGDVDGLTISTRRVRRLRAERLAPPAPTTARRKEAGDRR
jgi:CubicO group peptidase (beta-lactamase class C family)